MNITHEKLITAVIEKSRQTCPNSLALVGIYGSAATGDTHPKSDLDLLIIINDPQGYSLADTFILENEGVAYDLYCTTWQMLENDAEVRHARLAKLMDSKIAYVNDQSAPARLQSLREKAAQILSSDQRFTRCGELLTRMKIMFADAVCADSLGKMRGYAAQAIDSALDITMLYGGRYFHRGIRRTFEELEGLPQPENFCGTIDGITTAESPETLADSMTALLKTTSAFLKRGVPLSTPTPESLTGTAEEMYSNWKNKLPLAAENGDRFASFMTLAAFQSMLDEVTAGTTLAQPLPLEAYDPGDLYENARLFDSVFGAYVREVAEYGVTPRKFKDADDFIKSYLN